MKLEKREPIRRDDQPWGVANSHRVFGGLRKRSFGFHAKQRVHPPKVQHPKPSERVAA